MTAKVFAISGCLLFLLHSNLNSEDCEETGKFYDARRESKGGYLGIMAWIRSYNPPICGNSSLAEAFSAAWVSLRISPGNFVQVGYMKKAGDDEPWYYEFSLDGACMAKKYGLTDGEGDGPMKRSEAYYLAQRSGDEWQVRYADKTVTTTNKCFKCPAKDASWAGEIQWKETHLVGSESRKVWFNMCQRQIGADWVYPDSWKSKIDLSQFKQDSWGTGGFLIYDTRN